MSHRGISWPFIKTVEGKQKEGVSIAMVALVGLAVAFGAAGRARSKIKVVLVVSKLLNT